MVSCCRLAAARTSVQPSSCCHSPVRRARPIRTGAAWHLHRREHELAATDAPMAGAIAARAGSPPPFPPAPAETAPYPIFHSRDRLPDEAASPRRPVTSQEPPTGRPRSGAAAPLTPAATDTAPPSIEAHTARLGTVRPPPRLIVRLPEYRSVLPTVSRPPSRRQCYQLTNSAQTDITLLLGTAQSMSRE